MKWLSCFAMELKLDEWAAVREMTTLAEAVPPVDTQMPRVLWYLVPRYLEPDQGVRQLVTSSADRPRLANVECR